MPAPAKLINKKFFNIVQNIPGTTIIYKNLEDTILWNNDYAKKITKQSSLIGKKGVDFFTKETVEFCREHDNEIISLNHTENSILTKQGTLIWQYDLKLDLLIMKKIYFNTSNQPEGIIINSININNINFNDKYKELQSCNDLYKLQYKLYFNVINPLKEILLLNNIMQETVQNNADALLFCREIKEQVGGLLSNCSLAINKQLGLADAEIYANIFKQKINLYIFLAHIINKFNKNTEYNNIYISLILLNNMPSELYLDKYRLYKILTAILEQLIKDNRFSSKVTLILKVGMKTQLNNNKQIFFIVENARNVFINFDNIYQSFKMALIRKFILELNGYLELINKHKISYIYIDIPV